jgi:ppGpp synthetase/RelA/SpoT-type nucleotidyltranferase
MISKPNFFDKYDFNDSHLKECGLIWEDLVNIYDDYLVKKRFFEPVATLIVGWLKLCPQYHASASRIKDAEHVIEKIIRESIEVKKPYATLDNYSYKLNDLIGVRLIHKFKDEWESINDWIISNLPVIGKPEAHIYKLDPQAMIDNFKKKGFIIKPKDVGYRSLHYHTKFVLSKSHYYAEIQVRTLYEDAWGEVDHKVRYPYFKENSMLKNTFEKASCAAGLADGLGSLAKLTREQIELKKIGTEAADKKLVDIYLKIEEATANLKPFVNEINKLLCKN